MRTKNLVQACANVIKITQLKKGDVYKRLDADNYSEGAYFGVVTGLYNSGEKTFIEALEYKKYYGDIKAEVRVFSGDKDLNIFPTEPDEVKEHLNDAIKRLAESVEDDRKKLTDKIKCLDRAKEFVSGETSKQLTEMSFEEITQEQYNTNKRALEMQMNQLNS